MDQIRPMLTKFDRSGQNGPNMINFDRIEPKCTKWTEYDQCGPNKTKVNKI